MAWSSAGQSNAPSSSSSGSKSSSSGSKSSSDKSSGGWGSASYAANNSSQMSGGYRSDGGSSSGSGWGGKSTANPSVTSQYGGGSSSSSGSSSNTSLASAKRSAESLSPDGKTGKANTGGPTLAGAEGALAPTMDAWSRNTNYTDGKAGVFGSEEHVTALKKAAENKTMTEGQIATARAMIAGEQANTGQRVMGGLLNTLGTAVGGLPGAAAAKVASMGVNKLTDSLSGYADNAAYQQSKALASKDESLVGKALGMVTPKGMGSMVSAAYDNATGDYSTRIGGLRSAMREGGYLNTSPARSVQMNGSNNANGLLNTMFAQRQVTQPDTENSIAALNYGNFTPSYGSVI